MKKIPLFIFWLILPLLGHAQKSTIGFQLSEAIINRYQPTINEMTHKGWDHSNSVILHGMEKIYLKNPDPKYLAYIQSFVDLFVDENGNISELKTELDGIHPGILCLFLWEQTGEEKYKTAATNIKEYLLGSPATISPFQKNPAGGYWHKNNDHYEGVMTIDGTYMANPFLLKFGVLFKDTSAINAATFQTLLVASHTFNSDNNLLYHGWDSMKKKSWANKLSGTSPEVWSRSIGWFSMALVDMLEYLPPSHHDYDKILNLYQQLTIGIKNTQQEDGLWSQMMEHENLPQNYPEISGSGMMIYALKKGIINHWINESYNSVVENGWLAQHNYISLYKDGLIQIKSFCPGMGIQDNAQAYVAVRPVDSPSNDPKQHPHGYCALLMASSIIEK